MNTKKQILVWLLTLLTTTAFAQYDKVLIDGIYYNLIPKAGIAHVTGHQTSVDGHSVTKLRIPDIVTYEGTEYKVTQILERAFRNMFYGSALESVVIGDNVETIGNEAFYNCPNLKNLTIGKNVSQIGDDVFYRCETLDTIYIPSISMWLHISFGKNSRLQHLHHLFIGNEEVEDIEIPEDITTIPDSAFYGLAGLKSAKLHEGISSIGSHVFSGCENLVSVNIPLQICSVPDYMFEGCKSLPSMPLHDNINSLGVGSFMGCGFTTITIPETIEMIGYAAFEGCKMLQSVIIPNSVKSLGSAFGGCESLTYVKLPDQLEKVTGFGSCKSLEQITIPNTVKEIGNYAFKGCTKLSSIKIPDSVKRIGGYAFWKCDSLKSIIIPNSVELLDQGAFYECSHLESCVLSENISVVENYAFKYSGLKSITIPKNIEYVKEGSFAGCKNLESVIFKPTRSKNGKKILETAFDNCTRLKRITFEGNTIIYTNSFRGCKDLEDVYCFFDNDTPSYVYPYVYSGESPFLESYVEYATLHVPEIYIDKYKSSTPWSQFGRIVPLTDEDFAIPMKPYDLNGDGTIDVGDIMAIINFMGIHSEEPGGFDLNGDGIVDIGDIMYIVNIMAQDRLP